MEPPPGDDAGEKPEPPGFVPGRRERPGRPHDETVVVDVAEVATEPELTSARRQLDVPRDVHRAVGEQADLPGVEPELGQPAGQRPVQQRNAGAQGRRIEDDPQRVPVVPDRPLAVDRREPATQDRTAEQP